MNAFNPSNYPTTTPATLIAGDRWAWKITLSDYPASEYTLSYQARREGDPQSKLTIEAQASGNDHLIEISSATTEKYKPGRYHWQMYIKHGIDRATFDAGVFDVKPDLVTKTTDPRGHVKRVLDAVEKAIEDRASQTELAYTIDGRSISKIPHAELLVLRDRYLREYNSMLHAERLSKGMASGRRLHMRLA